ncbi:MAG: aldo/keto reductase [Candidatus Nitrohelix vancouverensis]|uniref:Aldo/keto reductase n=1 Tax=Candidatus Nitrohelix vancouverensis TaxID=2705534 RepID=A0A7T0G4V3_9BACT|nr:MAG: aldo/keto reductase [Candidatus Nitrohelix vancouverensis]
MEYRLLGESDLKVSVVSFGAWGVGGAPFWKNEGDAISAKAILKAYELGVTCFDTAPVYGFGHSEKLIGKTLKSVRDKVVYATKCGLVWEKESLGSISRNATKASVVKEAEDSLRRMGTDWIDLYQVHWPDEATSQEETMEALLQLKESGKIRHIGVSNYSVAQMNDIMQYGPLVSVQPEYSLLNRSVEKELLPFCVERHVSVVAYSPLASGVLTGKYDKNTKFSDWRSKGIIGTFKGEGYHRNIDKVEKLKRIATEAGKTCAQVAINWILQQPAMATALLGFKNETHVEENLQAIGWKLGEDQAREIDAIFSVN